jgi:hypothetical protein
MESSGGLGVDFGSENSDDVLLLEEDEQSALGSSDGEFTLGQLSVAWDSQSLVVESPGLSSSSEGSNEFDVLSSDSDHSLGSSPGVSSYASQH